MSPKLPHLKSKEVVRLLKEHGFEKDRQVGSHAVFLHPDGRRTTVPTVFVLRLEGPAPSGPGGREQTWKQPVGRISDSVIRRAALRLHH